MEQLDEYMLSDVYSYLSKCDKAKCKKYDIIIPDTWQPYGWYGGLEGIIEMVNYGIILGEREPDHFYQACLGGNMDIIKLMIPRGHICWESAFSMACDGGYMDVVVMTMAKVDSKIYPGIWNVGLEGACQHGHKNISELMIDKGANDFDTGVRYANYGDRKGIVEMMVRLKMLLGIKSYEIIKAMSKNQLPEVEIRSKPLIENVD